MDRVAAARLARGPRWREESALVESALEGPVLEGLALEEFGGEVEEKDRGAPASRVDVSAAAAELAEPSRCGKT